MPLSLQFSRFIAFALDIPLGFGIEFQDQNAGIMVDSNTGISELNLTIFQNTLETNAFGPLLLSQAILPLMKTNDYGRIVNMLE